MNSKLDSSSSTQSPSDSFKLPTAIATRIPPELLLDIFSIVSNSPSKVHKQYPLKLKLDHEQYLERNRNLKSFALVHWTWRLSAREVLKYEICICGRDEEMASGEEVERISRLLVKSKVQGTKYLTVDAHLNMLIARTGLNKWSQLRYLKLCGTSRRIRMSDFAPFPLLQELHLGDYDGCGNLLCFDPSDVDLRFPHLRRITFDTSFTEGLEEDLACVAAVLPITHKLFSPSNMPNLRHLALFVWESSLQIYMLLLAKILPQITSLALATDTVNDTGQLPAMNPMPDNLRHLSLGSGDNDFDNLLCYDRLDLESLHLTTEGTECIGELLPHLVTIAKGEDPKYRIRRIVIYGERRKTESRYKGPVDDLNVFEWRESKREYPPFEDFDGR